MATIQDLPPELIDLILLNFWKREYALRACSLLSKQWRTATLPHLFSTLTLELKGDESSSSHITTFLDLHPHVSACVKHLWLSRWPSVDAGLIRALLSRLPALERLSLELTTIGPPPTPLRVRLHHDVEHPADGVHAPPYRIQVLIINQSDLQGDPSHLLDILALCEVETFKAMFVRDAMDNAGFMAKLASLSRCIRIQDLRLGAHNRREERCPTGLLRLLRAGMVPGYLRSVEFTCNSWDALGPAGELLRDVGQKVTTFKLSLLGLILVGRVNGPADRWHTLQLSSCTGLEEFHLLTAHPYYLLAPWRESLGKSLLAAYADILRTLPPSVRTIRLRLSGDFETVLRAGENVADTADIERAVLEDRQNRFPELEAIVLEMDMPVAYGVECVALAARLLPRLHDLGLLRAAPTMA
ncbi:hypothetical protein C8T65DRAFT_737033 [Cerioporus squamosus]|nr:hypothetical protein C8T65DRAFT_737033 [Cerioporus squamosus]